MKELLTSEQLRNCTLNLDKEWQEGRDARRDCISLTDNPYRRLTSEWAEWRLGWKEVTSDEHIQAGLSLEQSNQLIARLDKE